MPRTPGEIWRDARVRRSMQQDEAAEALGVTPGWLCRRERDDTQIKVTDVRMAHPVLRFSVEDLLEMCGYVLGLTSRAA